MANLVDRLLLHSTGIELVWCIIHDATVVADVLIRMDDSWRDDYRLQVRLAHDHNLPLPERPRVWPVVPQVQLEVAGSDERKTVRLLGVLVWNTSDAGRRLANDTTSSAATQH